MSAGANKSFTEDPVAFMRSNFINPAINLQDFESEREILLPGGGTPKTRRVGKDQAVVTANLAQVTEIQGVPLACKDVHFNDVPFYILDVAGRKRSFFSHAFKAYWLPYRDNEAWTLSLGTDASYFFTASMNGCSLAWNRAQITHVNRQHLARVNKQEMSDMLYFLYGSDAQVFNKKVYKPRDQDMGAWAHHVQNMQLMGYHVTVIGIRGAGWRFLYQRACRFYDPGLSGGGGYVWVVDKFCEQAGNAV